MSKYLPATLGLAAMLIASPALAKERSALETASVKAATDCVAAAAVNNPNITTLYRENRLNEVTDWIVLRSSACDNPLRAMRLLHDRLYGQGTGQVFLLGDYLADLPRAVGERIKVAFGAQAGAALPPSLPPTAAQAAKSNLINSGVWSTDYFLQNGKPMCAMTVVRTWPNGAVGTAQFKWSPDIGLFAHVTKSNWSIPAETGIPLKIAFDSGVRDGIGYVIPDQRGGSTVEIGVNDDAAVGFMEDIANAKEMTITFDSGNEQPWITTMIGSRKAVAVFDTCIGYVKANAPTQPGAQSSAPTSPTGKATSPVQPRVKDDGSL